MEALARGHRTTIHSVAWPQKLGILLVSQTYQLQAGLVGFVFHLFWLFFHLQTRLTERETECAIQHHRGGGGPRTHYPTFLPGRGQESKNAGRAKMQYTHFQYFPCVPSQACMLQPVVPSFQAFVLVVLSLPLSFITLPGWSSLRAFAFVPRTCS